MGMYTEIYVSIDLRQDTPQDVIDVLAAMCELDGKPECMADKPDRWSLLFNNGSYYTSNTSARDLSKDMHTGSYSLIGKGDIKNYSGEIEQFFEWIKPWSDCENAFIGFIRREEDREPTLVYS